MEEPKEWVKSVTWELAALRAEIHMIRTLLMEVESLRSGETVQQIEQRWEPRLEKIHKDLYREILVRCGLPVDLGEDDKAPPKPS